MDVPAAPRGKPAPEQQDTEYLLETAERILGRPLPATTTTHAKRAMIIISHEIEAALQRAGVGGRLYAFFQEARFVQPEARRYERFATQAEVHVAARPNRPWPTMHGVHQHDLGPESPFAREWCVIVAHPRLSVALLTVECPWIGSSPRAPRQFRGAFVLDAQVVGIFEHVIRQRLNLPPVRPFRQDHVAQIAELAHLMTGIIGGFEEHWASTMTDQ